MEGISDAVIEQIQDYIKSLKQVIGFYLQNLIEIESYLNNDEKIPVGFETITLDKNIIISQSQKFYYLSNEILCLTDSFSRGNIKDYSDDLSSIYMYISNCCFELQGIHDQIIVSNVVTEPVIENLQKNTRDLADKFNELIESAHRLKATTRSSIQFHRIGQRTESASKATKKQVVITVNLVGLRENTQEALNFQQYLDIAKYTDFDDPLFKKLTTVIFHLADDLYNPAIRPLAPPVTFYASIVGPSYMGKTQFAFSLARLCPVFYVNFASAELNQDVSHAFNGMSKIFIDCLTKDVKSLGKIGLNSGDIILLAISLKLETIGLLWCLVKHSTRFKGFDQGAAPSDSEWFKHYLEERKVKYKKMTYGSYLRKLKDLVEPKQEKKFNIPIVFIDEFQSEYEDSIELLRNLCKIIGLRCVLASSNTKVNYLWDEHTFGSAGLRNDRVWVHTIRELPKANVEAIVNSLGWDRFFNDLNEFDTAGLLNLYGFELDVSSRGQFDNLIKLMIQQAKSCLPGVSVIVFNALKEKLDLLKEANRASTALDLNLNVQDIWKHILAVLREKLYSRKPAAFQSFGPYHTLAMISDFRNISNNIDQKIDLSNRPIPTAEIVKQTIDNHFYYFGTKELPEIILFEPHGLKLHYKKKIFTYCAHFNLFKDDLFLCMALWTRVSEDDTTIASIVCQYMSTFDHRYRFVHRNDSTAQECMTYWSLCNSTHTENGSIIPGIEFLKRFIKNIQTNQNAVSMIPQLAEFDIPFDSFKTALGLPAKLRSFLLNIEIPYLLPESISENGIEAQLAGICKFGNCERLPNENGYDMKFDLLHHKNEPRSGIIECNFTDADLSAHDATCYIVRARERNYPFNILVTYSLGRELKSRNYFSKIFAQPSSEPYQKKLKTDNGNAKVPELEGEPMSKMAIYSVFYAGGLMKVVPLLEFADPEGVFIIVQTNFRIPKNND